MEERLIGKESFRSTFNTNDDVIDHVTRSRRTTRNKISARDHVICVTLLLFALASIVAVIVSSICVYQQLTMARELTNFKAVLTEIAARPVKSVPGQEENEGSGRQHDTIKDESSENDEYKYDEHDDEDEDEDNDDDYKEEEQLDGSGDGDDMTSKQRSRRSIDGTEEESSIKEKQLLQNAQNDEDFTFIQNDREMTFPVLSRSERVRKDVERSQESELLCKNKNGKGCAPKATPSADTSKQRRIKKAAMHLARDTSNVTDQPADTNKLRRTTGTVMDTPTNPKRCRRHNNERQAIQLNLDSSKYKDMDRNTSKITILRGWKKADWNTTCDSSPFLFHNATGKLEIRQSGIYLIYSQITYKNLRPINAYRVYTDKAKIISQCDIEIRLPEPKPDSELQDDFLQNSCYTSTVASLARDQILWIGNPVGDKFFKEMSDDEVATFWGLIKL